MGILEKSQELAFSFFYVVTERAGQSGNESKFGTICWGIMLLVDAGQVFGSFLLPIFSWSPDVLVYIEKVDIFKALFSMVRLASYPWHGTQQS
jgi:hypothetical protein